MADYILRATNPSKLMGPDPVYLTEDGKWSNMKHDAKVFTAKTKATAAKKEAELDNPEVVQPDFKTNRPVEDAV